MSITLHVDGREVTVSEGATIWEAARSAGIAIPTLCHQPGLDPVGVCRMFVVEVEGARVMAGQDIYRIGDLDQVWIEAEVYEFDALYVHEGQLATVELPSTSMTPRSRP